MPKHIEKILPKFDPNKKDSVEAHINKFMLVVKLMNVWHEYFIHMLFSYMFENKAST